MTTETPGPAPPPSDRQRAEYFQRSYVAVDGLWFVKTEEARSFDEALGLDETVWGVMPKIQQRKIRELFGISERGLAGVRETLERRFQLEGYAYECVADEPSRLVFRVRRCPWLDVIRTSGRDDIAGAVGARICTAEYTVWAKECGPGISFRLENQLCDGCDSCALVFRIDSPSDGLDARKEAGAG